MNEELRSATEELETSREELQSINEELTTVNQELKSKVDELGHANSDLQNLMAATAIATVFLDRELRITRYTPSAVELFNLIPADLGRPLSDLRHRLDYPRARRRRARACSNGWCRSSARCASGRALVPGAPAALPHAATTASPASCSPSSTSPSAGASAKRCASRRRCSASSSRRPRPASPTSTSTAGSRSPTPASRCIAGAHARGAGRHVGARRSSTPTTGRANVEAFRRLAADGTPFEMEKRYVRGDGTSSGSARRSTAVLDADDRPTAAIAIVLDVSDRRRAEQALRESEERLRLIVDNAREYAIFTIDLKRRITGWNSGAEALLGYIADEVIGESADIIFIEEDRVAGAPQREAAQALAEGRAADERWHRRKNGSRFWGSGVMMAMRDGDGTHPIGLLKIFRDQTQARAAEQALETSRAELVQALVDNRKARAEAEAASHAKDRFLAILSHELRTPLTPVVMALHALERNAELPGSLRGTVELIRRNVSAELMLIDDLLDVTRISSGKLEMARVADRHARGRPRRRRRLRRRLRAPSASASAWRCTRRATSSPATRRACSRSSGTCSRTPPSSRPNEGEIKVVTSNVDDRLVLIVADTGIGIASEALPTIFDAFAQEGPWVTSEFGGLGLGLAIAKATIEAHHGTLVAASSGRNQGATFTIELPLD